MEWNEFDEISIFTDENKIVIFIEYTEKIENKINH